MPIKYEAGLYKVTQMHGKEIVRRDFDAEEWRYEWISRADKIVILRLLHDHDPDATDTFDFVEFSTPVSIEFEWESQ